MDHIHLFKNLLTSFLIAGCCRKALMVTSELSFSPDAYAIGAGSPNFILQTDVTKFLPDFSIFILTYMYILI